MLTAQQMADVRRFAGYPMLADTVADDSRDFAYGWVSPGVWQTLEHRLTNMKPEEESILINTYLTPLYTLETAITSAGDNLDTDVAAVWTHNKNEVSDRTKLFDQWRRRMCYFIGVAPGPSLGNGGTRIVRG
ncbi:hypothetical protein [Burkholderia cepacia]|uniref:hypothetical protein n=1 Tax=Burkholderia cepacia TaxID=292 RepID=UPI00075E03EB|nr:hypothetical protein [Burkholderia cepacia]KVW15397.1 hypothetical protein WK91_18340 [Burkholderia cepacia]MDW9241886.1 putative phage protein [Burkholderia cepacia]